MTEQELVFTLAFCNLGGGFILALYWRFQALRALEKDRPATAKVATTPAVQGREAATEA
jgi:hypothetical protein